MKSEIQKIKFRGGARIGSANATIPFASLQITKDKLVIKSLVGTAEFTASEVTTIKEVIYIPFLGQGIKILHNKPDVPKTVVFWSLRDPEKLIAAIHETGFRPRQENLPQ